MINPGHPRLSIVRQCELVSISRSSFYREPTPESERRYSPVGCIGCDQRIITDSRTFRPATLNATT